MAAPTPVLTVTDAARQLVLGMRENEADGDALALRIDVTGTDERGQEYTYDLLFEPVAQAKEGDAVFPSGELPVLIPADSVDRLQGAVLDHNATVGLVIRNPNRPSPAERGPVVLEGTPEEKVQALLEAEINPGLAMHGGFARLDRVEGDVAYITMGGGCQGCGLASMTLSEGIKAQIEERIPEIREVVDVTNHAAGENPFFEPTH